MTPTEELRRLIIQKLHPECESYEEALIKERCCFFETDSAKNADIHYRDTGHYIYNFKKINPCSEEILDRYICAGDNKPYPITAVRILQAFRDNDKFVAELDSFGDFFICDNEGEKTKICNLDLDAELDDQTPETKAKLLELFKNN